MIRSFDTESSIGSDCIIASFVPWSISNPRVTEKRSALIIRRPSSEKRSAGSPTVLISFLSQSLRPSNGSMKILSIGSYAMAFIVKSLRARSSLISDTNSTLSGCLPSSYPQSFLYVVISYSSSFIRATIVPCFSPTLVKGMPAIAKRPFICSGVALVVISKSCGVRLRYISLTQPPTRYASKPVFLSI